MNPAAILLIDHDETVLESRKAHVEAAGFRVVTWPWSAGTMPTLRPAPELIVLDLESLDGEPLADFVHSAARVGGRCVVIVADGSPADLDALVESSGALGWITKGSPDDDIVAQIRAQLRRKQRFTGRNEPLDEEVLDAIRRGRTP